MPISLAESFQTLLRRRRDGQLTSRDKMARAQATALLMHMSLLFGFPIFLVALFTRDDPFVLHHAKGAGVAFILFYTSLLIGILWSPVFFWIALALYIPSLIGVWRASGGQRLGALSFGLAGEVLFFPFQLKSKRARLGSDGRYPTYSLPPHDDEKTGKSRQDR